MMLVRDGFFVIEIAIDLFTLRLSDQCLDGGKGSGCLLVDISTDLRTVLARKKSDRVDCDDIF